MDSVENGKESGLLWWVPTNKMSSIEKNLAP